MSRVSVGGKRRLLAAAMTVVGALALSAAPAMAADGTGTMAASPTYVVAGSTGNDIIFTYTAGSGGINNGNIEVLVPTGWPTPDPSGFNANGLGGTCGADSTNGAYTVTSVAGGHEVEVVGLTLTSGSQCTIDYGISGFNAGVTAPTTAQTYTFTSAESSTSGGTLTNLTAGSPQIRVGNDGTGTMTVSPVHVIAGSTGNTITFTYTAAAAMSGGELTLAVPSGWSTPSTSQTAAGYTTTTCSGGSVGVSGSTIEVTGITVAATTQCKVTYGDTSHGGPGATAQSTGGFTPATFTTQQEATNDSNLVAIGSSPKVTVTAGDGAGTMTVSPTNVIQSSTGNYLTFTYTAPAGGLDNGNVYLLVPTGWPKPDPSGFNANGLGGTCGADTSNGVYTVATVSGGNEVETLGLSLAGGAQCTIEYGISGFNSGVTAPSTEADYAFTTQEQSYGSSGALTAIASSPSVLVGSDGTGTLTVAPTHVVAGSTGNSLKFTYTAGVSVSGGELTIAVPAGWSTPTAGGSGVGSTTTTCTGASVSVSGSTIQITNVTLTNTANCTVTYSDATAQSTGGPTPASFAGQEKSSSGGTLTAIGAGSPKVTVTAGDGAGTMTVSPTNVITSSTGNDLTFTYTAPAGGLDNGNLEVLVPTGWPTPDPSGFNANGLGGTCGADTSNGVYTVSSVSGGHSVEAVGLSLQGGGQCTIEYGITGFNAGVTAPSTSGPYTFTTTEQSYGSTGSLTAIGTSPVVNVGSDGTGTMSVSPPTEVAGSTGDTLSFAYTAATNISGGEITIAVPSGWTAPTTTTNVAGAVTSSCAGTLQVSGSTIEFSNFNLSASSSCTIKYGDKSGGGSGVTAPSSGGGDAPYTFTAQEKSSSGGTLATLGSGSPQVVVVAADGSGSLQVSPTTALNGSTGQYTFTYTAPAGGLDNGEITIAVPSGWSAPQTLQSSSPGYVVDQCGNGTPGVINSTIVVSGVTIDSGTCTIIYGDTSFGGGAVAPAGSGLYTFTAKEKSTALGTLTALGSSPSVNVSSDGAGTLNVAPGAVSAGSGANTLTFTYHSTVSLSAGEVTIALPAGWSAPSTTQTAAGYTTTNCGGASVQPSGNTVAVSGISIAANASCTVTYGDVSGGGPGATAGTALGSATFSAQEKSSSGGTLAALSSSPQLTVYAADGAGTVGVVPAFVPVGSTGETLTFTYTAPAGGISGGTLQLAVPAGWSSPSSTGGIAGYTTSTCGNVGIAGNEISITSVSLSATSTCTVTYGDKSKGGAGANGPSAPGGSTFTAQQKSTAAGTLTALASSPQVDVTSADGAGAIAVTPTTVRTASTGNTLTFTYTAATGGTNGGELALVIPSGWTAPSSTASDGGFTTTTCAGATVAPSGSTIDLTGVTLAGGDSCKIVYGSMASGGPGATAPASNATSTFATSARSTAGGTLTALSSSPTVTVSAFQTLTVSVAGSGKGTVSGGGISCPGVCSHSYPVGSAVTLTASAASGSKFTGWSGACTGTGGCTVTVKAAAAVTATFTINAPSKQCVVPKLKGDSLSTAERLLRHSNCAVGKISKPKVKKHHKQGKLIVKSTKPGAGSKLAAGSKVAITLVAAPAKKHHKH